MERFSQYLDALERLRPFRRLGQVRKSVGSVIECRGLSTSIGELCEIELHGGQRVRAEVVGFHDRDAMLMPLDETTGVEPGNLVAVSDAPLSIGVGRNLLGRVLDGTGRPLDGRGPLACEAQYPVHKQPPNPLKRERITRPLATGIRAIDALLTCGQGQRVGIFAGSGVGKSMLLGMIARNTSAAVNVIALIGERGREVRDFLERDLGQEGLLRSVVVVVTSEKPAFLRVKGALIATTIAEYFATLGLNVLLMMDSLTRVAMAQREIGLAVGEPPTSKGYTPSVLSLLPRLLERAGNFEQGSITGLYTVLVEGDDLNDPVADTARSILDGHIVLARKLAQRGHYPAVDVLQSISRVMNDVVEDTQLQCANQVKEILATYEEAEDLINIGAYVPGSNPRIDYALERIEPVVAFLKQDVHESATFEESQRQLQRLLASGAKHGSEATANSENSAAD